MNAATAPQPLPIDVISIQSQVVYGHVGNNAAVPTLQAMGLRVAAVPTVLLSNTPHYPSVHGGAIASDWFAGYLRDLIARGAVARARAVLVGFLADPGQAALVADWLDQATRANPGLRVHVDPVIGDFDHGVYTDPRLTQAWRTQLLPRAYGLTPNHFELERLTGDTLATLDEAQDAAARLLDGGTEWVVVTSAAPQGWPAGQMQVALVTRTQRRVFSHPHVPCAAKGVGDMFAARLAGHLLAGKPIEAAVDQACQHVVAILRDTAQRGWEELALPTTAP
ncbi:pyridoxine/pyridoxal/pyridoxamine kinase [Bordetella sp. BOR01]|uniref:pyridoxine/pyridoxal/pyridoxamine kinase n=1 Tax=Bordetella sp. BOR01 TaxID=2854779 RepID=UPI001C446836|nr:pyridoxine/pyridoxal/pyridoxamine kinase [Bordetella sp. BOR01]MBV7482743.1 pyridoxine/pyridoxal/pyridoxamine kinase [Bordetella sp. BOR01]